MISDNTFFISDKRTLVVTFNPENTQCIETANFEIRLYLEGDLDLKSVSRTNYSKLKQIYTDIKYGNKNSCIKGGGNGKIKLSLEPDKRIVLTNREIYDILVKIRKKFDQCKK